MIRGTDEVLDRCDTAVADPVEHRMGLLPDAEIFEVIRCVVLDLNAVDARHDGPYETGKRERLCEYIEAPWNGPASTSTRSPPDIASHIARLAA